MPSRLIMASVSAVCSEFDAFADSSRTSSPSSTIYGSMSAKGLSCSKLYSAPFGMLSDTRDASSDAGRAVAQRYIPPSPRSRT